MVGVVKAQQVGGFAYVVPVHEEVLALLYDKGMDVTDGGAAGCPVNDITQITG